MADEALKRNNISAWLPLTAIPLLAAFLTVYYRLQSGSGYPLDDSWIHLAFARNLAHGAGFGVNPGQLSAGSTSPLWALLLAVGFLVDAGHNVWPWILGMVCLAAAGLACALVIARMMDPAASLSRANKTGAAVWGGLLTAGAGALVWSAAGAMEIPLFATLALFAWAQAIKEYHIQPTLPRWGFIAGAAALARPEGLLFAALLALFSRRRTAARGALFAFLVYSPYLIYCLLVSGRPFPSTFYAKTTTTVAGFDLSYLGAAAKTIWRISPPLTLLFLVGIGSMAARLLFADKRPASRGRSQTTVVKTTRTFRRALPGILFVVLLPAAYATMGRTFLFAGVAGNFGRYFFPLVPMLAAAGAALIVTAWKPAARATTPAILAALLIWNLAGALRFASFFAHNVRDINSMQVEMARRLERDLPPGSKIAANDIGALAYFTRFRVLDLVGIVSPEVQAALFPLRRASAEARQQALYRVIERERPDALVVFPRWYPGIMAALEARLTPLEQIRVPGNITSAKDELDAFRIDWNRGP